MLTVPGLGRGVGAGAANAIATTPGTLGNTVSAIRGRRSLPGARFDGTALADRLGGTTWNGLERVVTPSTWWPRLPPNWRRPPVAAGLAARDGRVESSLASAVPPLMVNWSDHLT